MRISNIIFDFDGTLVDTLRDVRDSLKRAFEKCNIAAENYAAEIIVQLQLREAIQSIAPGITAEQMEMVVGRFREIYDSSDYPCTKLMPTVDELLSKLKEQNIGMYIVSNKRRVPTLRILDKFNCRCFFTGIFNPDMYEGKKLMSKSGLIAHAIEKHALPKDFAVYVGDSETDVIAAKENGVVSVAVTNGYGRVKEFKTRPDHVIPTIFDLLAMC